MFSSSGIFMKPNRKHSNTSLNGITQSLGNSYLILCNTKVKISENDQRTWITIFKKHSTSKEITKSGGFWGLSKMRTFAFDAPLLAENNGLFANNICLLGQWTDNERFSVLFSFVSKFIQKKKVKPNLAHFYTIYTENPAIVWLWGIHYLWSECAAVSNQSDQTK